MVALAFFLAYANQSTKPYLRNYKVIGHFMIS